MVQRAPLKFLKFKWLPMFFLPKQMWNISSYLKLALKGFPWNKNCYLILRFNKDYKKIKSPRKIHFLVENLKNSRKFDEVI